jgi:hypothetical protein
MSREVAPDVPRLGITWLNLTYALQVIMPGYCVQGTVGHKILSGQRKLEMEGRQVVSPTLILLGLAGLPGLC